MRQPSPLRVCLLWLPFCAQAALAPGTSAQILRFQGQTAPGCGRISMGALNLGGNKSPRQIERYVIDARYRFLIEADDQA